MNLQKCCAVQKCLDVRGESLRMPVTPQTEVRVLMIAESVPVSPEDTFESGENAGYWKTTREAFRGAGIDVQSFNDLAKLGVAITTAIKCAKSGNAVSKATVEACLPILRAELENLPNLKAIMLMGDTAIAALNSIAKQDGEKRVIPNMSTYKILNGEFTYRGIRVFPSYLMTGPNLLIERSKMGMISQTIRYAFEVLDK